jgi:hypothetical protein
LFYISVTATSAAAATVAKEEEYEANSDDDPDVFAVKKVAQAVHTKPPFRESLYSFTLILFYALRGFLRVWLTA